MPRLPPNSCRALLVALAAATGTPGGASGDAVQRPDSAGVEIVVSPAEDRPLDWTFERVLTLGGTDEGPQSFYEFPYRALVGADDAGDLYVLDRSAYRVVSFDAAGSYLRTVGQRGEGPGELSMPMSLSVGHDGGVSVYDVRRGVLVRFAADGSLLEELSMSEYPPRRGDIGPVREMDGRVAIARRTTEEDAQELVVVGAAPGDGGMRETTLVARVELMPPRTVAYERCRIAFSQEPVFWPHAVWDARGSRIALNVAPDYRIDVVEGGRLARSIRRDLPPRTATRELAIRELGDGLHFRNAGCDIGAEELLDNHGMADRMPWLAEVRLSPDGGIWARRREVAEPKPLGPPEPTFDIFDASGAYIGTTPPLPGPLFALLPDDRFVTVERDALDIERVGVWHIRRP